MNRKKPIIALCYDYDGTLIRGNMQENSFIPNIGMEKDKFWEEVKRHAKKHDMDEVLAYMQLMLKKAKEKDVPFNKDALTNHGRSMRFFPGVKKWFECINAYAQGKKINVEHYTISSGLDDMIRGSDIYKEFAHIFASGFMYDANGAAEFPARSINYTTKVQYLFRINKGVKNSWDNTEINKFTPERGRPIPFSRMIYIGDGETDVPAMKMMNYKGGYSIAVYPPRQGIHITKDEQNKKDGVEKLQTDNRCQFVAKADYTEGKPLYKIVTALIDRISDEHKYAMNLKAT